MAKIFKKYLISPLWNMGSKGISPKKNPGGKIWEILDLSYILKISFLSNKRAKTAIFFCYKRAKKNNFVMLRGHGYVLNKQNCSQWTKYLKFCWKLLDIFDFFPKSQNI